MTKLVLIHGTNNQHNTQDSIRREWGGALNDAFETEGIGSIDLMRIDCVFYGGLLYERSSQCNPDKPFKSNTTVGKRGPTIAFENRNGPMLNEEQFEILNELSGVVQANYELLPDEVLEALEQMPKGNWSTSFNPNGILQKARCTFPHKRNLVERSRVLSGLVPSLSGPVVRAYLDQTYAYLHDIEIQEDIHCLLDEQIFEYQDPDEPLVIISHSLGTVIAYNLLSSTLKYRKVKSLYTVGSPLGSNYFASTLGKSDDFPSNVNKWYNCWDKADFCAFNSPISATTLGFDGVANINTFNTDNRDKHSITSYLRQPALARLIAADIQDNISLDDYA